MLTGESKAYKLDNLISLGVLGKGSYGTVRLVKLNSSGKHYALKGMLIEQVRKQAHFLNMIYVE
jgi:serine/threonine protein kinase